MATKYNIAMCTGTGDQYLVAKNVYAGSLRPYSNKDLLIKVLLD